MKHGNIIKPINLVSNILIIALMIKRVTKDSLKTTAFTQPFLHATISNNVVSGMIK